MLPLPCSLHEIGLFAIGRVIRGKTTWPVQGGRLVNLGRRSGRAQVPTLKNDSLGGRMQTASLKFRPHPKPGGASIISRGQIRTSQTGPGYWTERKYSDRLVTEVEIAGIP